MANKKIVILLHNGLLENVSPKVLSPTELDYGELAINYNAGNETIFLKNSDDEIIGISQDDGYLDLEYDLSQHLSNYNNPHSVTKADIGLDEVDNTSDANKPITTALQTELDTKLDYNIYNDLVADESHPEYVYTEMEWSSLQALVLYNLIQSQLDPEQYLSDLEKRVEALEAILEE